MDLLNKIKNTGFIQSQPSPNDYLLGTIPTEVRVPNGDWRPYITKLERQFDLKFDTLACTSFSASHDIEMQCNWLKKNNKFSQEALTWFQSNGYLDSNGNFDLSERALAKMSGTTTMGNTFQKVWDTARTFGMIPNKDWTFFPDMDWNSFYANIPQVLLDKAKIFLKYVTIQYEWVYAFQVTPVPKDLLAKLLTQSPVQISIPIPSHHATNLVAIDDSLKQNPLNFSLSTPYVIYDTYDPFYFYGDADFPLNCAFRSYITANNITDKYAKINEDYIAGLKPLVQRMARNFIAKCKLQGFELLLVSGYRNSALQDILYAQGRTTPGKIVTNAKGGQSFHNYCVAIDVVPVVNDVVLWNSTYKQTSAIGKSCGFDWGGDWIGFKDMPHFECKLNYTLSDFQNGKVDESKFL